MKYYRVIGHTVEENRTLFETIRPVDTIVTAESKDNASLIAADGLYWLSTPNIRRALLAEIEQQALADWNAGKPTASPLALAQARGEL